MTDTKTPQGEQKKILLVDDEQPVGKAIQSVLQKQGFDVIFVLSVDEGMKVLKEDKIDLCITDLSLPGKTGLDLIREIREDEKMESMPVIVLSGFVSVVQDELASYKPFRVFRKPPPLEELRAAINEALQLV